MMNYCKCGCGTLVKQNYKRGHGRRGKTNSIEHNKIISQVNKGVKKTDAQKKALSFAKKGIKRNLETREKISKTAKERGVGKWMLGRKLPKKVCEKISASNKGHKVSEDIRQKISKANDGKKNGMYGKKHTKETKSIISARSLELWKDPYFRKKIYDKSQTPENIFKNRQMAWRNAAKKFGTTIERIVESFLVQLNIPYKTSAVMWIIKHHYPCDFYLPKQRAIIECDGDYWHNYPNGRDIDRTRTEELKEKGFKVLRLWERDIRNMTIDDFKDHLHKLVGEE